MIQKYHVNNKGEVRPCEAEKKLCHFGSERHFSNEKDARVFYEKEQEHRNKPLTMTEMNNLAKTSSNPKVLKEIAKNGSDRVIKNLANNIKADENSLRIAYKRSTKREILQALENNENFSVSLLNEDSVKRLSRKYGWLNKIAQDDLIDDKLIKIISKYDSYAAENALKNPNNRISQNIFIEEVEKNKNLVGFDDYRYLINDRIDYLNDSQLKILASKVNDSNVLQKIYEKSSDSNGVKQELAQNENTSLLLLENLANNHNDYWVLNGVYHNPNSTEDIKKIAANKNDILSSLYKIEQMKEEDIKNIKDSVKNISSENRKRQYLFDKDIINKYNMSKEDITIFTEKVMSEVHTSGQSYNSDTGIFEFWID